ncbi:hypothetical protein [Natronococcus occultus]|uniref:Uncharacterized protein n=1 Tax=Natronococcus occultus SP4 TaxID=694430 RepID=L0JZ29_9EURY|nr:hypothetical protein [Natronococcus occultus]AGB38016.1 hypothetical protein Natoc_2238 [Natronococcus occultus SP4]
MSGPVHEWSALPAETPFRRVLVYAPYGLYGGFGAWIVAAAVVLVIGQALIGSPVALALVVALVGGPVSIVACWLVVRHDSLPTWLDRLYLTDRLSLRGLALAIAVGAAAVGVVGVLWPRATFLLVFLGTMVLAIVSSAAEATVEFAPSERRVTVRNDRRRDSGGTKRIDLANVTAAHRLSLGTVSLYVCRRVGASPTIVSVPDRHRPTFERALEDGTEAAPTAAPRTPSTTRPMRIVLGLVAVKFAGLGLAVGYFAASEPGGDVGRVLAVVPVLLLGGGVTFGYACYEWWLARRQRASASGRGRPDADRR